MNEALIIQRLMNDVPSQLAEQHPYSPHLAIGRLLQMKESGSHGFAAFLNRVSFMAPNRILLYLALEHSETKPAQNEKPIEPQAEIKAEHPATGIVFTPVLNHFGHVIERTPPFAHPMPIAEDEESSQDTSAFRSFEPSERNFSSLLAKVPLFINHRFTGQNPQPTTAVFETTENVQENRIEEKGETLPEETASLPENIVSDPVNHEKAEPQHDPMKILMERLAELNKNKTPEEPEKNLIDQFIEAEPSIKIDRAREGDQRNLAEKSTTESFSVVSETLAHVYEKQGLFEKALVIYEKLLLANPEKSSYFAPLIENCRNKL